MIDCSALEESAWIFLVERCLLGYKVNNMYASPSSDDILRLRSFTMKALHIQYAFGSHTDGTMLIHFQETCFKAVKISFKRMDRLLGGSRWAIL